MPPQITQKHIDMISAVLDGNTLREIAYKFGISKPRLADILYKKLSYALRFHHGWKETYKMHSGLSELRKFKNNWKYLLNYWINKCNP